MKDFTGKFTINANAFIDLIISIYLKDFVNT